MTRIGVTGHIRLAKGSASLIYAALTRALADYAPGQVHGVTCLAEGTDQLFARAVLARRGTFDVVLPAIDYPRTGIEPDNRGTFDRLLRLANQISVLRHLSSNPRAYIDAGNEVLNRCDMLIAVWDRAAESQRSYTGTLATTAERLGIPVRVIWPEGAARATA